MSSVVTMKIPSPVLDFAHCVQAWLVPARRSAGFDELDGQRRGDGDMLDLIGGYTLWRLLVGEGRQASLEITSGRGDRGDVIVPINGRDTCWNVKTSAYAPLREGLHLYVKAEETDKLVHGYVQAFVHLNEAAQPPHVHLVGCISASRLRARRRTRIPRTNHEGYAVGIDELIPMATLVLHADRRPD